MDEIHAEEFHYEYSWPDINTRRVNKMSRTGETLGKREMSKKFWSKYQNEKSQFDRQDNLIYHT
jgi:hypothetical protein